MQHPAADLARRLASEAEAVCRHYLSNGRRNGRYWLVGDVANTPGRSLFVRQRGFSQRNAFSAGIRRHHFHQPVAQQRP